MEASQITQNWMQAAAAAAAAAAVNSPQATTSGPPRTPPTLGGGNSGGSPVGGQGAGACNASNPNMSSKGKFSPFFFTTVHMNELLCQLLGGHTAMNFI